MTGFEATNSVFIITDKNNSFSITIPGHSDSKSAEETINELNKLLELRSQNVVGLHVKEVRRSGNQIKIRENEYKLSDFDTQKNVIIEELENAQYNDLEDMVYRFQLTNI